jgi:general secretion pathway protein A
VFLFDHFDPMQQDVLQVVERLQHLDSALAGWTTTIIAVRNGRSLERMNSLVELSDFRIELKPLDQTQTSVYVQELLKQAGAQQQIFEEGALAQIHRYSSGIPREINRICDFVLLAATQEQRQTIDVELVSTVAEELQFQSVSDGERVGSQELVAASDR